MAAAIKAIVFKTTRLTATRSFFENVLQLRIIESSERHFVVHSKKLRVVFIASKTDFGVELFVNEYKGKASEDILFDLRYVSFRRYQDPNGISITIVDDKNLTDALV